ncbi:MAG: hypothetical protein JSU04_13650 [Bdellovibrionales bacterium]|nr:hypothetical protein [Bdellovibrionales bacterium]
MFLKTSQLWLVVSSIAIFAACNPMHASDTPAETSLSSAKPELQAVIKAITPNICSTVPEYGTAKITCPAGQTVSEVIFASYGSPTGSCGAFKTSSCNAANSLDIVKRACLGKASCSIEANNGPFGDPCEGTGKSLSVQVTCSDAGSATPQPTATPTPAPTPTATPVSSGNICGKVAEHGNANIACPAGQTISKIVFASYGAATGSCGSYKVASCHAANSMTVLQACVGKSSCVIAANNTPFGDPCEGVQKSLTYEVQCSGTVVQPTPTPSQGPGSGSWTYDLDTDHAAFALYALNDSGALVATPTSSGAKPYAFAVYNEFGKVVAPLSATAQANGTYRYALPTSRLGYFEIKPTEGNAAVLIPAIGSRPAGMITYAVLKGKEANPSADFQDEFTSVQGTTLEAGADYLGSGTYSWLGYSTYGTSYYSWRDCSPNEASASADCQKHMADDPVANIYKTKKMIPLFYMNEYPLWAVASTNGSAFGYPPKDMNKWKAHLEYVVPLITQRYQFLPFRRYQITWEPNDGWGWYGTDEQFLQIYSIAYSTIKKYDPTAVVMGPTITNFGPEMKSQLQRLLSKGLGNYMNALSWHPYPAYSQIYGLNDGWIADFRAMTNQAMGRVVPMYLTESGMSDYEMGFTGTHPVKSNFAVYHGVANVAMALLAKNDGASLHTYFYTADYASQPRYGLFYNVTQAYSFGPNKVSPKPDVSMIRQANDLLNHSNGVGRLINPSGNTNLQVFYYQNKRSGVYTSVLWDPSGNNGTIALPVGVAQVKVMDAHGNASMMNSTNGVLSLTLGITPVYVEGIAASALIGLTPSAPVGSP